MSFFIKYCFYLVGRVLFSTYKIKFIDSYQAPQFNRPIILAFWHQNLFATLMAKKGVSHTVPISPSKDGDYATLLAQKFGQRPVRGSSRQGNRKVLMEMIRDLRIGRSVGITVDGPIGPIHKAKPGVLELSRKVGVPIIPFNAVGAKYFSFSKSWDQFRIPIPFTTIYVFHGDPIQISPKLEKEAFPSALNQLEEELQNGEDKIQHYIKNQTTWIKNMNLSKVFKISTLLFLLFLISCKAPAPKTLGPQTKGDGGEKSITFSPCPDKPNCYNSFSSEDGDHYFAPVSSKFPKEENIKRIKTAILAMKGEIILEKDSYIHATFTSSLFKFIDDLEVYFNDDGKIYLKSASRTGRYDFGVNLKRLRELEFKFNQNSI